MVMGCLRWVIIMDYRKGILRVGCGRQCLKWVMVVGCRNRKLKVGSRRRCLK